MKRQYLVSVVIVAASSDTAGADGCGSSPEPGCIKVIVGNPTMINAYNFC